jgi:ribose transport system permease protein
MPSGYRAALLLWAASLALFLLGEWRSPGFLSWSHAGNIFRTAAFVGIAAIGQTLVVLTGGIDLSVGALISLGNVFACLMLDGRDENNLWAIPLILLIGLAIGFCNGVGVSLLGVSPMVMSLATGAITIGLTLIYSRGAPSGLASPWLRHLGVGMLAGITFPVWLWLGMSGLTLLILKFHTFGRGLYHVGANEAAAVFAGLGVKGIKTAAYALSGLVSALAGVVYAGYTNVSFVNVGKDFTMFSITAVVIGGTAMTGGRGGYGGTMAGAVLLCLIESLMILMNMTEAARKVLNGLVIIVLMAAYYRKGGRSAS